MKFNFTITYTKMIVKKKTTNKKGNKRVKENTQIHIQNTPWDYK